MLKYISFLILIVSLTLPIYAQNVSSERLKLAETFENSGDYNAAIKIYRELYQANPANENVFKGLVRTMMSINNFNELLPIVENHIQKQKQSTDNYSILAELYWKTGKPQDANNAWDKALTIEPVNENTFLLTANSQAGILLFEKAVSTLEKGREALNKKDIFAEELSRLYTAAGNYIKAADEVILLYEKSRNLPQAQGRISAILPSKEAVQYLENVLKLKAKDDNLLFLNLYAWFLKAVNKLEVSLEYYKKLDTKSNRAGYEVYTFANACSKDEQFEIALKAYGYVIDMGKSSPYLVNALFGFSRCLEAKNEKHKKLEPEEYQEIIKRYKNLTDLYPGNSIAYDAKYRIGYIYKEILKENSKAIEVYNEMYKSGKQFPITYRALHDLADIYFTADSIDRSKSILNDIIKSNVNNINNEKELAKYKLAELEYFAGNIDTAIIMFEKAAEIHLSNVSNDALEKKFLLEQNASLNKAIKTYALAEKAVKQKRSDEALEKFNQVIEITSAGDNLFELSLMKSADIYKQSGKFQEQRAMLNKLITEDPETIYADKAYYNLANSFYEEKNYEEALKFYTDMLIKFPKFIFIEDIREKIKQIRTRSNG